MADEVMSMPEAAAYLKIHLATLKRWIREGVIPVAKIGRRVLVRKQAVDEALRQHEQRRRPPTPTKPPETRRASSRAEHAS
jgi:excisionase family DNA binding protein